MHDTYPLDCSVPLKKPQLKTLWNTVSSDLRTELGDSTFDLWFTDFKLAKIENGEVTLRAPGSMYSIWVEENFKESLISTFNKYLSSCEGIRFDVNSKNKSKGAGSGKSAKKAKKEKPTKLKPRVLVEKISEEKLLERGRAAGLVEIFRFDNFVPGDNSELAWAAAQAVAESPGKTYQPLFFHSACGLGKTHLLHGIGWESLRRRPKSKIIFVTAEQFANDYIDAIQKNALVSFRKKYREADLLLIDDVQFLGRKEGLQQEFFHTFNALLEGNRQVILTSDRYPKEIDGVEDRLKSRFGWGLTITIEPPELETRVAILMQKAQQSNIKMPEEVAFFIAKRLRSNVRELEGALNRVIANANFTGRPITIDFVREALRDLLALHDKLVTIENIQKTVAEYYKIRVSDILSKRRSRSVARPRQMAMALAKELTNHSLPEIGNAFGGKDHTTVLHACRKINSLREESHDIKEDYQNLIRTLSS